MMMTKKIYTAPELTIVTVAVERGFASSAGVFRIGPLENIELLVDFNPIQGYTVVNDEDGENPRHFGNPYGPDPVSNNFWNF